MSKSTRNRKVYKVNEYERKILRFIFLFATMPLLFVIAFFYFIFSDLIREYVDSGLAGHFIQRFIVLATLIAIYYVIFCHFIFQFVHRIAGFYPRVLRELDEIIEGKKQAPLYFREGDFAKELIVRINKLLAHK